MTTARWLRRQLFGRTMRTILAVIGVAFGVATVTAIRLGVAAITVDDVPVGFQQSGVASSTAELRSSLAESLRPVSFLALVITGIVIGVANRRLVGQRWAEFATLRGLGLRRRRLLAWLLGEAGVIAVVGSAVGLVIGAVAGPALGRLLQQTTGAPPGRSSTLDLTTALIAGGGGLLVALAAALGTAWIATRATPATMSRPPTDDRSVPWVVAAVGVVLVVTGASVARRADGGTGLTFGVVALYLGGVAIVPAAFTALARAVRRAVTRGRGGLADLAVAPLTAHTRRLAVTVAVLASALVVAMTVETLRASQRPAFVEAVEVTWGGDAEVRAFGTEPSALLDDERIRRATVVSRFHSPGWCVADGTDRCGDSPAADEATSTTIIDPATYFDVAGLVWSDGTDPDRAREGLADGTGVAVSYLVAQRRGIAVGDRLSGYLSPKPFEVVGIYYGFPGDGWGADRDGVVVATPDVAVIGGGYELVVDLQPGTEVETLPVGPDDSLIPLEPTRAFYIDQFDRIYQAVSILGAVTGLLGLVSLVGVTGIEVTSRAEEFRMLRVLGLRRRQLILLVVGETAVLAALAAVVAVVAGTAAGWVLLDAVDAVLPGLPVPPRVPWVSAGAVLVIAPLLAACTAVGAGRTASKL